MKIWAYLMKIEVDKEVVYVIYTPFTFKLFSLT